MVVRSLVWHAVVALHAQETLAQKLSFRFRERGAAAKTGIVFSDGWLAMPGSGSSNAENITASYLQLRPNEGLSLVANGFTTYVTAGTETHSTDINLEIRDFGSETGLSDLAALSACRGRQTVL